MPRAWREITGLQESTCRAAQRNSRQCQLHGGPLQMLCANTHTMGNKQEELEKCTCPQGCGLICMEETCSDGSCDRSAGGKHTGSLGRRSIGRWEGGVTIYINDQQQCMELCLGMDKEPTQSLWIRIRRNAGTDDIMLEVCYTPLD